VRSPLSLSLTHSLSLSSLPPSPYPLSLSLALTHSLSLSSLSVSLSLSLSLSLPLPLSLTLSLSLSPSPLVLPPPPLSCFVMPTLSSSPPLSLLPSLMGFSLSPSHLHPRLTPTLVSPTDGLLSLKQRFVVDHPQQFAFGYVALFGKSKKSPSQKLIHNFVSLKTILVFLASVIVLTHSSIKRSIGFIGNN
jgi:hypothetical protein